MKCDDIKAGCFYYDGKSSVREVISIEPGAVGVERVEYRILAAKATKEYRHAEKQRVSIIGTTSFCQLASFAAWAKEGLSKVACDDLLLRLEASRVKLSFGELAFMESALDEAGGEIPPGTAITFDHTEGRAVGGLQKKLLVVRRDGEAEVTSLGAAWFRIAAEARKSEALAMIADMAENGGPHG